jgi:hypothetical protein
LPDAEGCSPTSEVLLMGRGDDCRRAILAAIDTPGVATSIKGVYLFCLGYLHHLNPKISPGEIRDYLSDLKREGRIYFEDGFIREAYRSGEQ